MKPPVRLSDEAWMDYCSFCSGQRHWDDRNVAELAEVRMNSVSPSIHRLERDIKQ